MQTNKPDYKLLCEEIFGPVVTTYVYPDAKWKDTLKIVDRTSPYALTGAVFANDRAGGARGDERAAQRRGQLLHQRQAHGRGGRPAAVRRRPRVGHERQGRLQAEPDPLGQHPDDQGNARAAARLPLPVHGRRVEPESQPGIFFSGKDTRLRLFTAAANAFGSIRWRRIRSAWRTPAPASRARPPFRIERHQGQSPSPRWIVQFANACAARKRRVAVVGRGDRVRTSAASARDASGIAPIARSTRFVIRQTDCVVASKRRTDVRRERAVVGRPLKQTLNRAPHASKRCVDRPARCQQHFDGRGLDLPPRFPVHQHARPQQRRQRRARVEADVFAGRREAAGFTTITTLRDRLRASRYGGQARYGGSSLRAKPPLDSSATASPTRRADRSR